MKYEIIRDGKVIAVKYTLAEAKHTAYVLNVRYRRV